MQTHFTTAFDLDEILSLVGGGRGDFAAFLSFKNSFINLLTKSQLKTMHLIPSVSSSSKVHARLKKKLN